MKKAAPGNKQSSRAPGKYSIQQSAKETAWMKHDRQFFQRNPRRSHHVRKLLPGELLHAQVNAPDYCKDDAFTHVLVRQLAPGRRMRRFICGSLPGELADWETFLSLLWIELFSASWFAPLDMIEQARAIDSAAARCPGSEKLQ